MTGVGDIGTRRGRAPYRATVFSGMAGCGGKPHVTCIALEKRLFERVQQYSAIGR